MELTVIRAADQRRMVISVEADTESDALRAIQNAVGSVSLELGAASMRGRRSEGPRRRARAS